MVKSLADFERENVHALTPNRKNLITNNCIGAISIILLDEEARIAMFELDPTLDSFFALAIGKKDDEEEQGTEMEEHVQARLPDEQILFLLSFQNASIRCRLLDQANLSFQ